MLRRVNFDLVIALILAVIASATARWVPSHDRLMNRAREDLALAERLGRGPVARELRERAATSARLGMDLRDSNDAGRSLALFAAIGALGTFGLPVYWSVVPNSGVGWRGPVMVVIWVIYSLFVVAALIGFVWWWARRRR